MVLASTSSNDLYIYGVFVLAVWVWVSWMVANAAMRKGRSHTTWFAISFFVSPILGAIIVATLQPTEGSLVESGDRVPCPRCDEAIRPNAKVCRFCGYEFEEDYEEA